MGGGKRGKEREEMMQIKYTYEIQKDTNLI